MLKRGNQFDFRQIESPMLRDGGSVGSMNQDLMSGRSDLDSGLGSNYSAGQFYRNNEGN